MWYACQVGSLLRISVRSMFIFTLHQWLIRGSTIRLFADDSLLYMTIRSQADNKILHNALKKLAHWEKKWFMEFDADKCHVQRVTRKHNRIIHDYTCMVKFLKLWILQSTWESLWPQTLDGIAMLKTSGGWKNFIQGKSITCIPSKKLIHLI